MREIGKEDVGLYFLLNKLTKNELQSTSCTATGNSETHKTMKHAVIGLWHKRTGHMSSRVLDRLLSTNISTSIKAVDEFTICPYAKQTRLTFPLSSIKTSASFDLLHIDVWGLYKTTTFDGNKYFLIIADDFTRMAWLFLLKNKSDVCISLQHFVKYVRTQFDKSVKIVRSDNGTEFVNVICDKFFKEMGIVHQRSYPYTPQQNGMG